MQPTGNLHIGNYLGALKNWARIQNDYECIFCIVDLHAVTVYQEPAELRAKIEEIAALYHITARIFATKPLDFHCGSSIWGVVPRCALHK